MSDDKIANKLNMMMKMMMMMIHSISSAPFICNIIYIHRRLAPQIVIILITYLLEKVCFKACFKISRSYILRRMAGREFQSRGATDEKARSPYVFRRVLGSRRLSPDVRKPGRSLQSSMRDDISR